MPQKQVRAGKHQVSRGQTLGQPFAAPPESSSSSSSSSSSALESSPSVSQSSAACESTTPDPTPNTNPTEPQKCASHNCRRPIDPNDPDHRHCTDHMILCDYIFC